MRIRVSHAFFLFTAVAVLFPFSTSGQVATGIPPFGSSGGGPFDTINLANLNVHFGIPVISKAGRGLPFSYTLVYDNSVWYPVTSGSSQVWTPVANFGWAGQTQVSTGYVSYFAGQRECFDGQTKWSAPTANAFRYIDPFGAVHAFSTGVLGGCDGTSATVTATDGSGYTIDAGVGEGTIHSPSGQLIYPPLNSPTGSGTSTDRNGNQITVSGSTFTDTLGTTALTISGQGTASSPLQFQYTAPNTHSVWVALNYTNYTVHTNFGCSGISDYGATQIALVSSVTLPDSTAYQITYEITPGDTHSPHYVTGRIASITLPTGGAITYAYSGGSNGTGILCADGSTATLGRQTPDGTWSYAHSESGTAWTTLVTDPQNNQTNMHFQGIYETEWQVYQGSIGGTLLSTVNTCYNGTTSGCNSTAITLPITQRNITIILPNGQQSEHDSFWNIYGGPTETDDYAYGAAPHGPLLKKILATYAPLGNITAFRQTVTVQDGGGATVSKVNYNYDESTPAVTSGTPQHVSVSTARGNLTSANTYTSSSAFLTKSSTYYDTGNLQTTTEVNGGVTTYNYASGAASCSNSFPTSITEAISTLSVSMTWNCTGGLQLTSTDENGRTTTTAYTDPYFWRPASITDPTNAITTFCYGLLTNGACTLNPNQGESTLNFNGSGSTVDTLTTVDGLGRTHVQQTRQAPGSSNFDSVETDYDALGRISRVTLPYSGTEAQTNSSGAATTYTYDAMNRQLTVADTGGGSTNYNYGLGNDVLVTRSPAPTWDSENTKRRQFEYDGLGRLTSVCEITAGTSAWPGGTCAQNTTQTGYWTKYTYDPMGNLLGLTQNAQMSGSTQSRSYAYDWMSRMISETVPEIGATGNGTASYSYDSDSTCGTYKGDLVKRVDAAGNVVCAAYDLLHRKTTITYPSGVYSSVTPSKHFIYDGATVNNQTMLNAKARLAEAYTCFSPCATKATDIGFSYTVRGESADIYESTPNSNNFYYHTSQTYWANGSAYQLTGNIGLPTTITYAPDGEGRTNTVSATSGQNPVSGTTYNPAGLPTQINFGSGSGDSDAYTWDPNTNRMTQYKFTVNGTSLTGVLGWNVNATLQSQNITDGFNSAGTQNCSYIYDDIARLVAANCGSAAAQTFAFDPFGNINKSGSPYSFQPTYSSSTNRMTYIAGFTPTYDSNGNVTNDAFHSYTWDADGHAITVDAGQPYAVALTYDALGRMAEQNRSGVYTQIVYSPSGQKLALMGGQTLQRATVPLSGKALAVYSSSGLQYYAHADLQGSIRLGTNAGRTKLFDTAYAPFGETYASSGTLDPAYTGKMDDTAHRQDTAGGLYDFPVREYSTQGRWPSPDPLGRNATCPNDPQTQNRYVYVRNNPMSYTDPTGARDNLNPFGDGGGGGGGGCDPFFDPECGCDPADSTCAVCDPAIDPFCGPDGGGGSGPDKGKPPKTEKPRKFPWRFLPLEFFRSLTTAADKAKKVAVEFTSPFGCWQNTTSRKACGQCCDFANIGHGLVCGALALYQPELVELCYTLAEHWAFECGKACLNLPPSPSPF